MHVQHCRSHWLINLILIGIFFIFASPVQAQESGEVVVLYASSAVQPTLESYIARGIEEADTGNAEAVVIVLDTPGGSVDATLNIVRDMRSSDVPVVVFVGPRGAKAASAGLLITLAGHISAMAPETAIGASSPVGPAGEDLPETMQQKAEEFLSAEARSLAERRGEKAVELADQAVKEARAVSAREALDAGLIDLIASDVPSLLEEIDGMEVEINGDTRVLHTTEAALIEIPMNWLERFQIFLSDPNVIALLLGLGPVLILIEARTPGGWLAGTLGTILTALALYGLGILPVNWLGLVLIGLALTLFFLEIKAPVHGVLTIAGAISLAAGLIILFSQPEIAPFGQISIPLVVGQSLLMAALFFTIAMIGLRAQKLRPATGYPALIGQIGRVTRDLDPVGMVQVFGERWRAVASDGITIAEGATVEVIDADRMRLTVRRTDTGSKP
jgi:membrane-bound serine protease (ClpP class)